MTVCLSSVCVGPVRVDPSDQRDKTEEDDGNLNEPNQQSSEQRWCWCGLSLVTDGSPHPLHLQGTLPGSGFPATTTTAAKTKNNPI